MDPHRYRHRLFSFSLVAQSGDPYEIRTRVAGVRGRSLRPLDQRAGYILSGAPEKRKSVSSTVSGVRRRILLSSGAAFSEGCGAESEIMSGTPSGTRTLDTLIKSQVL